MDSPQRSEDSAGQNHSGTGDNVGGDKIVQNFNGPQHGTQSPLQELLLSLRFEEMDLRDQYITRAETGTCGWLFEHDTYINWTTTSRGLLWIRGKPGSGKSTLLRHARDRTFTSRTHGGPLSISFFFHGSGRELQKTPIGFFRSLLYQLLEAESDVLPSLTNDIQSWQKTVRTDAEEGQLQGMFENSFRRILETRPIWLFVDALDECDKEQVKKLAEYLNSWHHNIPDEHKPFRICFTTRHDSSLSFPDASEICIDRENETDISTFVKAKLCSFQTRTNSTIPDYITKNARGVFLWAYLVVRKVQKLEEGRVKLERIEAEIRSVPKELNDLFRDLVRDMQTNSLQRSLKLVQWICFATRPLSLAELRWAMLVDADCQHRSLDECQATDDYLSNDAGMERDVNKFSRGLAEVTPKNNVQFIHQSVKDFFIENDGLSLLSAGLAPDRAAQIAQRRLSMICLRYLQMEEIGGPTSQKRDEMMSEFPFLHYATTSWVLHARRVAAEDLLESFDWPTTYIMERWVSVYQILEKTSPECPAEGTALLHVMSRYGMAEGLRAFFKRGNQTSISVECKDLRGWTPLSWAIEMRKPSVVALLLSNGAKTEYKYDTGGLVGGLVGGAGTALLAGAAFLAGPGGLAAPAAFAAPFLVLFFADAVTELAELADKATPLSHAERIGDEEIIRLLRAHNGPPDYPDGGD